MMISNHMPAYMPAQPATAEAGSPHEQADEPSSLPAAAKSASVQTAPATDAAAADGQQLSEEQQAEVKQLQQRDREVKAHEAAHFAAAAGLSAGSPSFTYSRGADGQLYATGGEVNIDVSPVSGDPDATVEKAQQIIAAANAPAQPSGQDRAVAAQAASMAAQARAELTTQQRAYQDAAQAGDAQSPAQRPPLLDLMV